MGSNVHVISQNDGFGQQPRLKLEFKSSGDNKTLVTDTNMDRASLALQ